MRKRLNTYASKKRVEENGDAMPPTEEQVEGEGEGARDTRMGHEYDQGEEDGMGGLDGSERMGGRMAGGSEIQGVYGYLEDEEFDK